MAPGMRGTANAAAERRFGLAVTELNPRVGRLSNHTYVHALIDPALIVGDKISRSRKMTSNRSKAAALFANRADSLRVGLGLAVLLPLLGAAALQPGWTAALLPF